MADEELANFRREMGLDSPMVERRMPKLEVRGEAEIVAAPVVVVAGGDKSPRGGSRLFGRRVHDEEARRSKKEEASNSPPSPPPPRLGQEDKSRRSRRDESSAPSLSPPSSRISSHARKKSAAEPFSSPSAFFAKKGSGLKSDVSSSRKEMMEKRRSRSLHNIFMPTQDEDDEFKKPGLFGMRLEDLLDRAEEKVLLLQQQQQQNERVPTVMDVLLRKIESSGGFEAEGIFRISVSTAAKRDAMRRLHVFDYTSEQGLREDPYLFAALLKEWLMRLPDPLIGNYGICMTLGQQTAMPEEDKRILTQLWSEMSPAAQAVVRRLMKFIQEAVTHEKQTKMGATNLCMVFFFVSALFLL
jgi:hypothetical protein